MGLLPSTASERWFGPPGAEFEPHHLQFLQTQAPVGREESRKVTQIFVRRKFCTNFKGSPL